MNISNVFHKTFLSNETKFLSGLSFIIISLVSLHFIFYQNFYNFSDSWIKLESRKITVQITPNKGEKRVPEIIRFNIFDFLEKDFEIENFEFISDQTIKKDLGLNDLHSFSKIRVPMLLKILMKDDTKLFNLQEIIKISENRPIKIHEHLKRSP